MPITQNIYLTVDAVVFGYDRDQGLTVLLIKRKNPPHKGKWALPGGFVDEGESLEKAVTRELEEEAGVRISYMEQLYTFGDPKRDKRGHTVSVAYFALVRPESLELNAASDALDAKWFPIVQLPKLAFDHDKIMATAITRLKNKATYEPIGFELLDKKFPFSELEHLYTIFLGRPIDRRNLRKKILSYDLLEELDEKVKRSSGRPASLYRFNRKKYFELQKQGIYFEI